MGGGPVARGALGCDSGDAGGRVPPFCRACPAPTANCGDETPLALQPANAWTLLSDPSGIADHTRQAPQLHTHIHIHIRIRRLCHAARISDFIPFLRRPSCLLACPPHHQPTLASSTESWAYCPPRPRRRLAASQKLRSSATLPRPAGRGCLDSAAGLPTPMVETQEHPNPSGSPTSALEAAGPLNMPLR